MHKSREIARHAVAGLGIDPSSAETKHTIKRVDADNGDYRIEVLRLEDFPHSGLSTLLTIGASLFDNHFSTPEGKQVRVEFIATAASSLQAMTLGLGGCAFNIASGEYMAEPETIFPNIFDSYGEDVSTPHAWITTPIISPQYAHRKIDNLEDEEEIITWLEVVPVTDAELEYAQLNGVDAMARAFFEAQPNYYNLHRESFIA